MLKTFDKIRYALKYEALKSVRSKTFMLIVLIPALYSAFLLYEVVLKINSSTPPVYRILHLTFSNLFLIVPYSISFLIAYLIFFVDNNQKYLEYLVVLYERKNVAIAKIFYSLVLSFTSIIFPFFIGAIYGLYIGNIGSFNVTAFYLASIWLGILTQSLLFGLIMISSNKYITLGTLLPFAIYLFSGILFLTAALPGIFYTAIIPTNMLLMIVYAEPYFINSSDQATLQFSSPFVNGQWDLGMTVLQVVRYSLGFSLIWIILLSVSIVIVIKKKDMWWER